MKLSKLATIPSMVSLAALIALSPVSATAKGGGERVSFEQLDANGDGALTQEEMAAHGAKRFADADTDGDGFLSAEELAEVAKARAGKRAEKRSAKMLKHLDANDDGKLSADEMKPSEERMAKRFERADKNDDGQLSQEEFEQAAKHRGHRGKKRGGDHGE